MLEQMGDRRGVGILDLASEGEEEFMCQEAFQQIRMRYALFKTAGEFFGQSGLVHERHQVDYHRNIFNVFAVHGDRYLVAHVQDRGPGKAILGKKKFP